MYYILNIKCLMLNGTATLASINSFIRTAAK